MLHRFPQQIFIDRAENLIGKIQRPNLFAAQIVYVNRCHIASHVARAPSPACLTLSSPLSSRPSTDPPSPRPRILAVLVAASSLS